MSEENLHSFNKTYIDQLDMKFDAFKKEIIATLTDSIQSKEDEIIKLKTRLIKPEISFEELLLEITNTARISTDSPSEFLSDIHNVKQITIRKTLSSYSEDTLWFWSVHNLNLHPTASPEFMLESLIQFLDNENQINNKICLDELKKRLVKHAQNEQLGKETIYSWLKIRLEQSLDLDDMTSNLLTNMIETILDQFDSTQISAFQGEFEKYSQKLDENVTLEQYLKNEIIKQARQDING